MEEASTVTAITGAPLLMEVCPRCKEPRKLKHSARGKVCGTCARLARRITAPFFHESGATILRAVRDPGDGDNLAFLCVCCCPSYAQVVGWLKEHDIPSEPELSVDDLQRALKALGARCDDVHFVRLGDVRRRDRRGKPQRRYLRSGELWNGWCAYGRDRERFKLIELRSGGTARRDPGNPTCGWVTCPDCLPNPETGEKEERYVSLPSGETLDNYTARCSLHDGLSRRTRIGEKSHKSGATLLQDERDPERPKDKAAFLCASRKQHPHDRPAKSYAWFSQFDDPDWHGLCDPCLEEKPRHRKDISEHTFEDGPDGAAGTRFFLAGDVWKVKYSGCECERSVSRRDALAAISGYKKNGTPYPPICRECLRPENVRARMRQTHAQNSNGQKNEGVGKKHPGPEKGFNAKITEEKIRAAFKSEGRHAPQETIAEKIGVDARSLRDWHTARGLSYRQFRQQFTETGGS